MARAGLTTDKVAQAGAQLADELGFEHVTISELARRLGVRVAGRSGRDALIALAGVYRGYATEHPGRYDAARLRLAPEVPAASAGPRLSQMLRDAVRGYDLAEPEQTHAVRLVGSLFHGYISLEGSGGLAHSEPDSATSWASILDALDVMLRSWPAPARA
ncbi:TetR-like C-terminal domain-containing protein [Aeromicrobium wangtongii]|uniref:WHG domain-containing protein n=1 Tax=Aeromicrobium wangtongii TaxID=2969247 RepID=A0ABY5M896_9ACTN|nr:TetR-like C-terminal domain-containing protein [Aeromicrobium wangtongii]MCD9199101.1 WHG domain-containing protein [Aeromicrobium wangtongii]UUP12868.1 WHG domain-containing protein [Aeromicrobium wangtongii]